MTFDLLQTITLIFIDTVSIFLLIVVSSNSLRNRINLWFLLMTLCLLGWVNFSYFGFIEDNQIRAILFYKLNWVFVSTFFFCAYVFFVENYLKVRNLVLRYTLLLISLAFSILSLTSDKLINSVTHQTWGNEIIFGNINSFFNLFSVVITSLFLYHSITKYIKANKREKSELAFFLLGTFALIFFNLVFNVFIPSYMKTARFQTFGDFSSIIFLCFTAFAILRYKFMGVKVALTAFLISVIGMFFVLDIFLFSSNTIEVITKIVILLIFIIISVLLVQSVLTEIKQKEILSKTNKELEVNKKQLFELANEQKDIIDVMGHELRTPLSIISMNFSLLSQKLNNKNLNSYIANINQGIKRENELISTMLGAAKIEKGRLELHFEKINFLSFIENSHKNNLEELNKKGLKFHTIYNKSIKNLEVEVDKIRIQEVFDNLINNAVKYTEKGSITVDLKTKDGFIITSIKDTGRGISKDALSHIGEKFFREDTFIHHNQDGNLIRPGGTGLGLYLCFGIVKKHRGEIEIKSKQGEGTEFIIKLPIEQK